MDVLITGGLGFVGSELLRIMSPKQGFHIRVVDNLLSRPNLKSLHENITFIKGDIRDVRLMQDLVQGADVVIHLAGIVGFPSCDIDPQLSHAINVEGTRNIAANMIEGQKLIAISSTSVYGDKANTLVTEKSPLEPLTSYGRHKAINEQDIALYAKNLGFNYIIFRPATAFGISEQVRIDLLPNNLVYNALNTGVLDIFQPWVIRPFIHVHDFARAIYYAIEHMPWNEVYNLGTPNLTVTKAELSEHIADVLHCTVMIREGSDPDRRNYDVSFDKLYKTGFFSEINAFTRGIKEIESIFPKLQGHFEEFTTPYNVRRFIESGGY